MPGCITLENQINTLISHTQSRSSKMVKDEVALILSTKIICLARGIQNLNNISKISCNILLRALFEHTIFLGWINISDKYTEAACQIYIEMNDIEVVMIYLPIVSEWIIRFLFSDNLKENEKLELSKKIVDALNDFKNESVKINVGPETHNLIKAIEQLTPNNISSSLHCSIENSVNEFFEQKRTLDKRLPKASPNDTGQEIEKQWEAVYNKFQNYFRGYTIFKDINIAKFWYQTLKREGNASAHYTSGILSHLLEPSDIPSLTYDLDKDKNTGEIEYRAILAIEIAIHCLQELGFYKFDKWRTNELYKTSTIVASSTTSTLTVLSHQIT